MCSFRAVLLFSLVAPLLWPQATINAPAAAIPLTIPSGAPLRLYVTKRFPKKLDAPVQAKLLTPVYSFDREVIPAGSSVDGHVSRVEPVSGWQRTRAALNGDFTPLRIASVEFTSVTLPTGRTITLHTVASPGLNTLVPLVSTRHVSQGAASDGRKARVKDAARARIDQVRDIPATVRATDKKAWLYDFSMSKLPYHSQSVRNRTRFDAVLTRPVEFGSASVSSNALSQLGSQPASGSVAHARLLTALSSRLSTQGEPVEAQLEDPLFSPDHVLVLPAGTRLKGAIISAKRAGWFHHGGRLRFRFVSIELSPEWLSGGLTQRKADSAEPEGSTPDRSLRLRTQAQVTSAEGGKEPIQVDSEGGVQAKESKTRFIGTALSLMVARAAGDNDPIRSRGGVVTGTSQNVAGRTLGGGLGFGLLGSIAAQSSRNVGAAFGYYGLAWSVFSTVVARGAEVEFEKNAVIDIGFNSRDASAAPSRKQ